MLGEHNHLFAGQESLEAAVVRLVRFENLRHLAVPANALRAGEELLHQLRLAAHGKVHVTVTDTWRAAGHGTALEVLHGELGFGDRFELDEAVHRLAGRALHDDVDGVEGRARRLRDEAGIAANCGNHLVLVGAVGNLDKLSVYQIC